MLIAGENVYPDRTPQLVPTGPGRFRLTAHRLSICRYAAALCHQASLQNSKTNLPIPEKQKSAALGLPTHSLRSSFHLHRPRPLTCFDVSTAFSGLPASRKSATIHSWHRPRSRGKGFGRSWTAPSFDGGVTARKY